MEHIQYYFRTPAGIVHVVAVIQMYFTNAAMIFIITKRGYCFSYYFHTTTTVMLILIPLYCIVVLYFH